MSTLASALWDLRRTRAGGPPAIADRQRRRVLEIVEHARQHSGYYRELYARVPPATDLALLPVTDKKGLMESFDIWVTDPDVRLARVREFIDDPSLVGQSFLDRYRVGTSSGSSGLRGIFLYDRQASLAVRAVTLRAFGRWLSLSSAVGAVCGGARVAMVITTGGHYGSSTVPPRSRLSPVRVFSVFSQPSELAAQLDAYRPKIVLGYAGQIAALAGEQEAGRMNIRPELIVLGAQGLPEAGYRRIERVFRTRVGNGYGACEFMCAASSCAEGWLHVNSDWVVLEPVDRERQPVPPGEWSHSVLLTNLANRVQPIIRYDLGDSVLVGPDPCPCGDPLPTIKVQGRLSDALRFEAGGREVAVPPVMLSGIVDRTPGIDLSQIVQVSRTELKVRLQLTPGFDRETVHRSLHRGLVLT